jgi:hypothetical protein
VRAGEVVDAAAKSLLPLLHLPLPLLLLLLSTPPPKLLAATTNRASSRAPQITHRDRDRCIQWWRQTAPCRRRF